MSKQLNLTQIDQLQSDEYKFPYHYLPDARGFPAFSKRWGYAPSYIAALRLVADWLTRKTFPETGTQRHMDYGCGDGGFIEALKSMYAGSASLQFHGIDKDVRAIKWARQFATEDSVFIAGDVADLPFSHYHSGTLIEVLEHIPPELVPHFVEQIARSMAPSAELFVTVPSKQMAVTAKHYQHFDYAGLNSIFSDSFETLSIFSFERRNLLSKVIKKLVTNRVFYFESRLSNEILINTYAKQFSREVGCGRIGLVLRRR